MGTPANYPTQATPIADKAGIITQAWDGFLRKLYVRTGGPTGDVDLTLAQIEGALASLPTSAPAGSGKLWNSAGTLKITP